MAAFFSFTLGIGRKEGLQIRTHIKGYLAMQVIRIVRKRRNHANIFSIILIKSKNSLIIIKY